MVRLAGTTAIVLVAGHLSASADLSVGAQLAMQLCADCHAIKAGQVSPKSDAPSFAKIANEPQMNIFALRPYLRTPHWTSSKLSLRPQDIDALAVYIMSLHGPQ